MGIKIKIILPNTTEKGNSNAYYGNGEASEACTSSDLLPLLHFVIFLPRFVIPELNVILIIVST